MVIGELGHGGALAARDDERVHVIQLLWLPYLHSLDPDSPQRCQTIVLLAMATKKKGEKNDVEEGRES